MALDVGQGLLGDTEEGQLHCRRQPFSVPVTPNEVTKPLASTGLDTSWLMEATNPRSSRMEGRSPLAMARSSATVSSTMVRRSGDGGRGSPLSLGEGSEGVDLSAEVDEGLNRAVV